MAGTDLAGSLVCDAGLLIHLEELGCLDLLRDFAEVLVPEAVWMEVQRHRPSALRRRTVKLRRVSSAPGAAPELIQLAQAFLFSCKSSASHSTTGALPVPSLKKSTPVFGINGHDQHYHNIVIERNFYFALLEQHSALLFRFHYGSYHGS